MKKLIVLTIIVGALCVGCTENVRSRSWGSDITIVLPAGQKLVNATWKEGNVWYLTRPMYTNETAEVSIFQEKANFGMMNGSIKFVETSK